MGVTLGQLGVPLPRVTVRVTFAVVKATSKVSFGSYAFGPLDIIVALFIIRKIGRSVA